MDNSIHHDFFPYQEALIFIAETHYGKAFNVRRECFGTGDGWLFSKDHLFSPAKGGWTGENIFSWWNSPDKITIEWTAAAENCICKKKHCTCFQKGDTLEISKEFTRDEFEAALATRRIYSRWKCEDSSFWNFDCPCGSSKFYRPQFALGLDFTEGSFCCAGCHLEHPYCSRAFSRPSTGKKVRLAVGVQASLFDA